MKIIIDRNIYSDECISKTIYEFSSDFAFKRRLVDNGEEVVVVPKSKIQWDENRFWDVLNDFKLRDIISVETKDIRTILFAKAFGDFEGLTEDDLQD